MRLGFYNAVSRHFGEVRKLTKDEITAHRRYEPIIAEARNRLSLFRLLERNFRDWRALLDALLSPSFKEKEDVSEGLNRLLLNYLTCAYTIREHFEVSFKHRFRHDKKNRDSYDSFLERLCTSSWEFAFFLDFRGYVQHRGLPVGRYHRQVSQTSVVIHVVADARQLTSESREWPFSHLEPTRGEIDLVSTLQDFHVQMLQNYAGFVARTFFPELQPASEFYARLAGEVKSIDGVASMVFYPSEFKRTQRDNKTFVEGKYILVPNDLFRELGIRPPHTAERANPKST